MDFSRVRQCLLPPPERDPRFRTEVAKASLSGLKVLGAVEIAVPILILLAHWLVHSDPAVFRDSLDLTAALAGTGLLTSLAARIRWVAARARAAALFSAWLAAALLIWASLLLARAFYGADDYIPAGVTLVMLTVVASVPARPVQTLLLGFGVEAAYAASVMAVKAGMVEPEVLGHSHDFFIVMLTLLSAGVTAVLYGQRRLDCRTHEEALRITEALTGAQLRAQLAENAASIGKLAAALTHEINTPLGALKSSVDTLLVLAARQATAQPEQQQRLVEMQAELRKSIQTSAERIQSVVCRLQRFISLEEAEVKQANLNDLLSDVALLFEPQMRGRIDLRFDLRPLPTLTCRPQLLTFVFSSLLSNAINAVNGNGRIEVSTRLEDSTVQVTIRDNGRGMAAGEVENIFDPGFRVSDDRVSSGNWSLFNVRQIIFEHGGDIQIESAEGKGTTVCVTIPC
ncbi:MAG: sensor histidine kinase [Bryobacteraceae bacterium]